MNAITGIENLIKQPAILSCPYWAAYADKVEDKNRLRDNYSSGDATIEGAEKTLRDFCNDIGPSGCNVVIWFSDKPSPTKGGYRVPFYMPSASGQQNTGIGTINGNASIGEVIEKEVTKRIDEYNKTKRLEELERENKELKKEIEGTPVARVLNRIASVAEPYIPTLMQQVFPMNAQAAAATVAGTTEGAQNENDEARQKLAENALTRLAAKRQDMPELLAKLADLADNNPQMFEMAIKML